MEIPNTIELFIVLFNLRNNRVGTRKDSMKQTIVVVKSIGKKCSKRIPNMRHRVKIIMGKFKIFIESERIVLITYNKIFCIKILIYR